MNPGLKVLRQLTSDRHSEGLLAQVPHFDEPKLLRVLTLEAPSPDAFVQTAQSLTAAEVPPLLRVYAAGRMPDGLPFAILDYLDAPSLGSGESSADMNIEVMVQLAEALERLHGLGLTLGPLLMSDVVLAQGGPRLDPSGPLSRRPAEWSVELDVQTLQDWLQGEDRPPCDSALRSELQLCSSASELREALVKAQGRWVGQTRPSAPRVQRTLDHELPGPEADLTGTTLGQYQLERVLGEGAMGKVYLGRHQRIGREAAVKVLKAEHSRSRDSVNRFIQEATAVNAIKNDHIVEVIDFGEVPSPTSAAPTVFCVMEVLQGRPLSAAMKEQLPVQRLCKIVQQLARALHAAHEHGVVHRDVKPENVFLHTRGADTEFVKVLDFGVAKLARPLAGMKVSGTQAGMVIGTPDYMAPEQALGQSTDFRADIYAMGLLLYEALAGRRPHVGNTFGALVVQITTQPIPPLPEKTPSGETVPKGLVEVVLKCLAKKPEERFDSAAAVADALEPFVYSGRTVMQQLPPDLEQTQKVALADPAVAARARAEAEAAELEASLRPSRAPKLIALAAAVVLLAGAAWFFTRASRPSEPGLIAAPPPLVTPPPTVDATPLPPPPAIEAPAPLPVVFLDLTTQPPGASVTRLDTGAALGKTPLKVSVAKADGEAALQFTLAGREPVVRKVSLSRDSGLSVDLPALASKKLPAGKKKKRAPSRDSVVDPFAR